jgi:hypothetical protein
VGVLVVVSALAGCVNLSYPPGASRDGGALAAQKAAGATCAQDRECQSAFCSFGVCCKTKCDGPCLTCAKAGSEGVCLPADEGTNPRGLCVDMGASKCSDNGTCDGNGACAKFPPGTICGDAKCVFSVADLAPRCNALGVCETGVKKDCKPYACGPDGNCLTMCTTLDHCSNPNPCAADGTCGKKALGTACGGGGECESGNCAQGVCCDKLCNSGPCVSCALKGSEGVCTSVPAGMPPPAMVTGTCPTSDVATCGTDGKCDGAGMCRLFPSGSVCNPATCSTATLRNAGTCDGKMHCVVPLAVSCGGYTCATSGTACRTTCAADPDCASPSVCEKTEKACGGLSAQYFRQTNLTDLAFSRTDAKIDFDWGGGSPSMFLNNDNFSVRWRGKLTPRFGEAYTFYAGSDDGERLFVNGQTMIDRYTRHASVPEDVSGPITLVAGKPVDITFEYFENGGDANVRLSWSSKSEPKTVIPTSALSPP